jgi:methylmalonyl-CoA epimerase
MMMDMLTEIDHVAIAVNDLEGAIAWYAEVFGATVAHRERVESDGVEEALLAVADSYVQLLTPIRDDSPVAKYLANKGEGLHHIGYRVDDCAAALLPVREYFAASGARALYDRLAAAESVLTSLRPLSSVDALLCEASACVDRRKR